MRKKKNCHGCKALRHMGGSTTGLMCCEFGYPTKNGKEIHGITVETIPLKPCPKPRTNEQYIIERNLHN